MGAAAGPRGPKRAGSRWLARAAALLSSTALCLTAAELYVRHFHADEIDRGKLEYYARATNLRSIAQPSSNPELVYELRPGLDLWWMMTHLMTDDHGSRISPNGAGPDPDVRVALVGDSVPFGWGVEYDDSYGAVLEDMLNAHGTLRVRVRNFAVPGYNIHHNRIVVRDRVLHWDPDLVILHYDHNDVDAIAPFPESYMGPGYGDNPLGSGLIKFAARRVFTLKTEWFSQQELPDAERPNLRVRGTLLYGGPQYDWHVQQLRELGRLLQDAGVPGLALVFFAGVELDDTLEDNEVYTKLHVPIVHELHGLGFTVVDSYVVLQGYLRTHGWTDMRNTWLHTSDAHPNPETHHVFAKALFDATMADPHLARIFGVRGERANAR